MLAKAWNLPDQVNVAKVRAQSEVHATAERSTVQAEGDAIRRAAQTRMILAQGASETLQIRRTAFVAYIQVPGQAGGSVRVHRYAADHHKLDARLAEGFQERFKAGHPRLFAAPHRALKNGCAAPSSRSLCAGVISRLRRKSDRSIPWSRAASSLLPGGGFRINSRSLLRCCSSMAQRPRPAHRRDPRICRRRGCRLLSGVHAPRMPRVDVED